MAVADMVDEVQRLQPFIAFYAKVREYIFDGISDADAQEWAVEAGLLVETIYDPAMHGEHSDVEPGDAWQADAPGIAEILDAWRGTQPQSQPEKDKRR